jgi:hypothetical protein
MGMTVKLCAVCGKPTDVDTSGEEAGFLEIVPICSDECDRKLG